MGITYAQLDHLNLSHLDRAITAWKEVVRKMKEIDESHGPQVQKPFEAAGWMSSGAVDTAEIARRQVRHAGQEAEAALKEVRAIESVLTETHDNLKAQQKRLHDYVRETTASGKVRISDQGEVTFINSVVDDPDLQGQPGYGQAVDAELRRIDEIEGEIRKVLRAAAEVDDSAGAALRYNVGTDKSSFQEGATGSTEKAEDRYDSSRAVQLAQKGAGMSNSELKEFNGLLKEHKKDPEFSERFATRMGGRGTLEFWEGMRLHGEPAPDGARKELLQQTRSQLGATLGTATQSDSKAMQDWQNDVIDAGGEWIDHDVNNPKGFQVMSDLMNSGRYDSAFLQDYGDALIEHEKFATRGGGSLSDAYLGKVVPGDGIDGDIDITNSWGTDPMTGYMNALGHNHEASTEFFKDQRNFDYVVGGEGVKGARDWPEDAHPQYDNGKSRGYDALGHALESAVTGRDHGDADRRLHRGDDERALMKEVMTRYGTEDKGLMDNQNGVADSMGRMGAAYIDDINYGLTGHGGDEPQDLGAGKLLGVKDHDGFEYSLSRDFIRELGQNEASHQVMSHAQQAYTTSLIHEHAGTPEVYTVAEWGVAAHGALDEARAEEIGKEFRDDEEARNRELEKAAAWKQAGVSIAVGGTTAAIEGASVAFAPAAAPIIIPIAEAGGTAAETALGNEIGDALKENEYDNDDKAIRGVDHFFDRSKEQARSGIDQYMDQHVNQEERRGPSRRMGRAYTDGRDMTDTDNVR